MRSAYFDYNYKEINLTNDPTECMGFDANSLDENKLAVTESIFTPISLLIKE